MSGTTGRTRVLEWIAALLIVAGLAAAALLGRWWHSHQRTEEQTQAVVAEARDRTEMLLSYDATRLDADIARGRAQVTADFAARYQRTVAEVLAPATRARGITTISKVVRAAPVRVTPGRVEVLLFVDQAVTEAAQPAPRSLTSQVLVTMSQTGDRWLIADLCPL